MWCAKTDRQRFTADALLGLLVGLVGQNDVWRGGADSLPGPHWAISLSWAVAAACIAFRRRAPFAALAVASVATLLESAVYSAPEGLGGFLAFLVLFYSVAAYEKTSLAITGLGIALASVATQAYLDPLNHGNRSNLVASLAFSTVSVVAWAGGFGMRRRRQAKAQQLARASQAELDRAAAAITAATDERARIARELHDVVSHSLGIVVVQAEAADELFDSDPDAARRAIEGVRRTARDGLVEMRRMLGVLRSLDPDSLDVQPGLAMLPALAKEVTAAGLPVNLSVETGERPVSAGVAISTYRIVQESLTNAIKHSQATRVDVRVRCGQTLELEIEDDGIGPDDEIRAGLGLVGIRERVAALGGTLDVGCGESGGFRLVAALPLGETS